jgi:hypothetical protein
LRPYLSISLPLQRPKYLTPTIAESIYKLSIARPAELSKIPGPGTVTPVSAKDC